MSMLGGEGPSKGSGFNQEAHGLWVTILIVHRIEDNIVSYITYYFIPFHPSALPCLIHRIKSYITLPHHLQCRDLSQCEPQHFLLE
jgi:hypothetical protein